MKIEDLRVNLAGIELAHCLGFGGMAGSALKPIGLGQVRQWRNLLPERIAVIGVGGVTRGRDILDYLRAGATTVQIATAFLDRGLPVFCDLVSEFVDELDRQISV